MENKVLASVNGKNITQQDVETFINRLDPQTAAHYKTPEAKKNIVQELINQALFLEDAIANKLEETEAYKLEMVKAREFILTQLNINKFVSSQTVTEAEAKAYFEKNPQMFGEPAKADTSHILVDTKEECEDILSKINNEEITFEDAASQFSKCPSKSKGGNLGTYAKGQMVPEYDNVSFAMEVNEISKPVKTQFGYHIIKLHSKTEGKIQDFETVKQNVFQQLTSIKQKQAYTEKVNQLRETHFVEMM